MFSDMEERRFSFLGREGGKPGRVERPDPSSATGLLPDPATGCRAGLQVEARAACVAARAHRDRVAMQGSRIRAALLAVLLLALVAAARAGLPAACAWLAGQVSDHPLRLLPVAACLGLLHVGSLVRSERSERSYVRTLAALRRLG